MESDSLDIAPAVKIQTERHLQDEDRNEESRFRDPYAAARASLVLYDLIDAENIRARAIAQAVDAQNIPDAIEAARTEAPITVINELLRQSNIPITISVRANDTVIAQKNGGPEYSVAELSDGERNALLIAGSILTAPEGTLLIIDEPERHLHRSIIFPLLSQLFSRRPDCGFVISTHDCDLALGNPQARVLLLRSCQFNGRVTQHWEADELAADLPLDDVLKRDLLGARRKILFVEGTEQSLDKSLYSLVFPMVSVIPKGNCRGVEQSVIGLRAGEGCHWLRALGIVDGDGFSAEQVAEKLKRGVYPLPYYSVESIYFHPRMIEMIAARQANVLGEEAERLTKNAIAAGVAAVRGETDRLSGKGAKKTARQAIMEQIPNDDDLLTGMEIGIVNKSRDIHAQLKIRLDRAVESEDWHAIVTACPVRETRALGDIATALRFQRLEDYKKAVRQLIANDPGALDFVRGLFDDVGVHILD